MKPEEARRISEANVANKTEEYLEVVYKRIEQAALKGHFRTSHPFYGCDDVGLSYPHGGQLDDIIRVLTVQGYKVVHYDNPDPGDPRSVDYYEVSWK